MTLVEIPFVINMIVAVGMIFLAIAVAFSAIVKNHKQMDLGEKEDSVIYGRNTKPIYGTKY